MDEQAARRERERMVRQSRDVPDHVRDGKTLPQQIEGDHAYRDDPPEYDPSLWATHRLRCLACGTEYPDAPAGERRERLNDGRMDVGHCPECDRDAPAVDPRKATPPNPQSGYDDTVWVVLKTSWDGDLDPYTRPISAYRDEEEARECAEEQNEAHVLTRVECIGLNH